MNIKNITHCYGCGVCALICPKKIIDIKENEEGFYVPSLNEIMCIDCGLCAKVCSYLDTKLSNAYISKNDLHSFAGWSKNPIIRKKCSSGGVSYEIAKGLLRKKYKVCAVRYDISKQRAEHYISKNEEELAESIGSKYIQSYTLNGFKELNKDDNFLVIGTPCQIDSIRRYIKLRKIEEHFILIDFFCHGVPSKFLWDKYLRSISPQIRKPQKVTWRNKQYGWHDSYAITIETELKTERYVSKLSDGDPFFFIFLNDFCLGRACYNACKYRYDQSSADIRLGDMWGKRFQKEEEGVSCIICFTEKGLKEIKHSDLITKSLPLEITAEYQMRHSPQMPKERTKLLGFLKKGDSFRKELFFAKVFLYKKRMKNICKSIFQKLCRLLK